MEKKENIQDAKDCDNKAENAINIVKKPKITIKSARNGIQAIDLQKSYSREEAVIFITKFKANAPFSEEEKEKIIAAIEKIAKSEPKETHNLKEKILNDLYDRISDKNETDSNSTENKPNYKGDPSNLPENTQSDLSFVIPILSTVLNSPYSHFVSSHIKSILFKAISIKTNLPKESKILAGELIIKHYPQTDNFKELISLYPILDTFRVSGVSFRNNILSRTIREIFIENYKVQTENTEKEPFVKHIERKNGTKEEFMSNENTFELKEQENKTKNKSIELKEQENKTTNNNTVELNEKIKNPEKKKIINSLNDCFQHLALCIPFVEHICKNTDNWVFRDFLILYCFEFLKSIDIDLLQVRSLEEIKDIDDTVVGRFFPVMDEIIKNYETEKRNNCTKRIDTSREENVLFSNQILILSLFNSDSMKKIVLSIYKRLFFFFLFKNKRVFQTLKVYNLFTKSEKSFIYKSIKTHKISFINIFKQLNQRYLLKNRELVDSSESTLSTLISCIDENRLSPSDLKAFYDLYFTFLEKTRSPFKIKGKNLAVLSEAFSSRLDKSFVKYIRIEECIDFSSIGKSTACLLFIKKALSMHEANMSETTDRSLNKYSIGNMIDPVQLVGLLVDQPAVLLRKSMIPYFNLLLEIIYYSVSILNVFLVQRLLPVLRKLLIYKEYTLNCGRLYRKICGIYKIDDPVFKEEISIKRGLEDESDNDAANSSFIITNRLPDFSLFIKACIGHLAFEGDFQNAVAVNDKKITIDTMSLSNIILASSITSYMYFNPEFSLKHTSLLQSALKMKNQVTKNFLEILRENLDTCSSFVAKNMALIQELFFYFEITQDVVTFPFEEAVLELLLESLKAKAILPCMAIPFINTRRECIYLYKNYKENCLNCINDCLYLIKKRIKTVLEYNSKKVADSGDQNSEEMPVNHKDAEPSSINLTLLGNIFDYELLNNFLYSLSRKVSVNKIIEKIDYQNDPLIVYCVLRYLRHFNKKEKEAMIKSIKENVIDEKIFELIEECVRFYEKNPKGIFPIEYLFNNSND